MAGKSMAKNATLSSVPGDRRCIKSGGSGWRCRLEAEPGHRYCSHHLAYNRNRSLTKSVRTTTDGIASENHDTGDSLPNRHAPPPLGNRKRNRGAGNEATAQPFNGKVKPVNNDAMLSPTADDLRCKQNAGSGWRCPSESQPGFSYCSYHLLRRGKCSRSHPNSKPKAVHPAIRSNAIFTTADGMVSEDHGLCESDKNNQDTRAQMVRKSIAKNATLSSVPDDQRCIKSGGSGWRCCSEVEPGHRYCSNHLAYNRNRSLTKLARTTTNGIASENLGARESLLMNKKRNRGAGNEATTQPFNGKVKPVNNDAMLSPIADELRCRKSAGSGWQCPSKSQPGFTYCSYHLLSRGKCSRSHPISKPKAAHTATRSNAILPTADGMASKDDGTTEWSPRNEEKRDEVMNVSSPLVMTALRETDKNNQDTRAQMARKSIAKNAMLSSVPDNQRCIKSGGSGWRCCSEAEPGHRYCSNHIAYNRNRFLTKSACTTTDGISSENHGAGESLLRNNKRYRALIAQELVNSDATLAPIADDLRCRQNGGSGWQCPSESQPGFAYCFYHLLSHGKCSRSHPNPKSKAALTATRSNASCSTIDCMASEDHGNREWLPRNEEKRDEMMVSSPLLMAALCGLAKKNRGPNKLDKGIVKTNLNPKGILLGLTKRMSLIDPIYILKETKVMVEIRICKDKGKSSEAYKFCGQTEDEAALAAMEFLQCVLLEISEIYLAGMEKCHGGFEEIMTESADRTADGKGLDREEVLLVKCKYLIDSALEDLEARHRTI